MTGDVTGDVRGYWEDGPVAVRVRGRARAWLAGCRVWSGAGGAGVVAEGEAPGDLPYVVGDVAGDDGDVPAGAGQLLPYGPDELVRRVFRCARRVLWCVCGACVSVFACERAREWNRLT